LGVKQGIIIQDSLIASNQAYQGGGLYLTGTSTIARTTLKSNSATNLGGGAVTNWNGTLTVSQSLFWDNQSSSRGGGGLQTWAALGQTTVENSTFFDNSATDGGAVSCDIRQEGGRLGLGHMSVRRRLCGSDPRSRPFDAGSTSTGRHRSTVEDR
jgi:hypothetical protein